LANEALTSGRISIGNWKSGARKPTLPPITDDGWVAGYSVKAAKTNAPINVATPTVITARKNLAIPAPTSAPKS
jgi:hypothetical protein